MIAAQVKLTESETEALREMAFRTGKTEDQLIREAIHNLLGKIENVDRLSLLRQAQGMWKDRDDLPDPRELRTEFDRW
jgi:predicted DNA-binding protein